MNVLLGGLPQYSHDLERFSSTISYYSDDYTWCVQRAKLLPLAVSFFRIATPGAWLLAIGMGYVNGFILYLLLAFDPNPENRQRDLHYTTYVVSLSSYIGVSQRFNPKHWPLRTYYFIGLLFGMAFFTMFFQNIMVYTTMRIRKYQLTTVTELIDEDFRFAGEATALDYMRNQALVSLRRFASLHSSYFAILFLHFQYPQDSLDSFLTCNDIDKCLEQLTLDDSYNLAVGVSRTHVMSTSFFTKHQVFCFDRSQNIANYTISLAIRNDHGLLATFDKIIREVLEGGLNVKWQRENRKYFPPDTTGIPFDSAEALGMDHLSILIYFVYIPGMFLAGATFFLERKIFKEIRRAQTARKRKFWLLLAKFCDGRRHYLKLQLK